MTPLAITFLVNVLTSIFKQYVFPHFGKLGVQAIVFVLAVIGAVYWMYLQNNTDIAALVGSAIALFSLSITFYEVVLGYFPWFKAERRAVDNGLEI